MKPRVFHRLLLQPVVLAALLLWAINDHFLKARFPGWTTGKLSDFAAMIAGPVLLFAWAELLAPRFVARRSFGVLSAAALACAATLALINLSPQVARAYELTLALPQSLFWALVSWSVPPDPLGVTVLHTVDWTDALVAPVASIPLWLASERGRVVPPRSA